MSDIHSLTNSSPRWSPTTKTVIGLTFAALIGGFLIYFRAYIGPLLLAFILTYLLHPVAAYLSRVTSFSWRASATVIYLLLLILFIGLSTLAGYTLFLQIQSLIGIVQGFVNDIPNILNSLAAQQYYIGPFQLDLGRYFDLNNLSQQILNIVQPILGQATNILGRFASVTLSVIGWALFILLFSYFLLAGAGKVPVSTDYVRIPGYDADIRRMAHELGRIWNAFLRGQLIITLLIIVAYTVLMTILGVRFSLGIAVLAGTARFVPYLGPLLTWTVTGLVAFFQGHSFLGLDPVNYTLVVIVACLILDQIFDNFIAPQIYSQTLRVHPAAVLLAALVAANLLGFIGLIVAAPVLASLSLIAQYAGRKMLDLDPWAEMDKEAPPSAPPWGVRLFRRLRAWWRALRARAA